MHPITVYSFGYLHPMPEGIPPFDITVDLRRLLADPAHRPEGDMLDMTGLDEGVQDFVFDTPGAFDLASLQHRVAMSMSDHKALTLAFGCAGGRHRSVAMAAQVFEWLKTHGRDVAVHHLHVHLPRVIRQETKS